MTQPRPIVMLDALVDNDYSLCLCNGLVEAGADIRLVTVEGRRVALPVAFPMLGWAPPKAGPRGAVAKFVHYLRYWRRVLALGRSIRRQGGVLHFQFFRRERIDSLFVVLLHWMGVRLVHTAHNIVPHEHSPIDRRLKRLVYRSVDGIVVHSAYIKRALLEAFDVPADKVHVVPHGNFDHYLPEVLPDRQAARASLGLEPGDTVLLFFGYIRKYKGLDLLLDAFEQVAAAQPGARLVIAGQPHTAAEAAEYRDRIERHPAASRIIFHGRFIENSEVAAYFTAADLVALPYRHIYHSGLVHLAFSFGKAVIATRVGDFPETIDDGETGLLVEGGSPATLASGILDAIADPDHLHMMGARARHISATRYAWKDIGEQTRAVYASLDR